MFTGIVFGRAKVVAITQRTGLVTLQVLLPDGAQHDIVRGASIALDGVCLTATECDGRLVAFDVMQETLHRTTLGALTIGSEVNVERSARGNAEVGGHIISGHVDCKAEVVGIETPENNKVMTFKVPANWMKYIFAKGFVSVNGCSLTVTNPQRSTATFQVWFIPETLTVTTFGTKSVGDQVNIEVERSTQVLVDTVEAQLERYFGPLLPKLRELLQEDREG